MKTEELKQGQTVFVKGIITDIEKDEIIDLEIHTSENNFYVNSSDVYASPDKPKPVLKKEHAEWLEELKNEFPDDLPNQLYHITRQGWGYGLVFESNTGQKIKISSIDDGKLKKDLVNALIYGYTVENEKLYTVEIPTNSEAKLALVRREDKKIVITIIGEGERWRRSDSFQLTEQEIRKDFEWAWQQGFAKEVTE